MKVEAYLALCQTSTMAFFLRKVQTTFGMLHQTLLVSNNFVFLQTVKNIEYSINLIQANAPVSYNLKALKDQSFSGVFRRCKHWSEMG